MSDEPKQKGIFSSLSLGRAARTPRQPSETLTHPLLGASSSSIHLPTTSETNADKANIAGPSTHTRSESYTKSEAAGLPYKPRQRHGAKDSAGSMNSLFGTPAGAGPASVSPNLAPISTGSIAGTSPTTPTATTGVAAPPTISTSTSTTFALPPSASDAKLSLEAQHSMAGPSTSSSATARLQQQSVKAAAQKIGLGNGTMGMSMLDAVYEKCQLGKGKMAEGGDWADVIKVLTAGKAVLLLPTTPASSLPTTPQILRDHIVFIAPPDTNAPLQSKGKAAQREDTSEPICMVASLSGMIGTMRGTKVQFESILPSDSPLMLALRDVSLRQTIMSSLRPTLLSISTSQTTAYDLSSESASLPFPPVSKAIPPDGAAGGKDKDKEREKATPAKFGRINPFASFFGANTQAPSPTPSTSMLPSSPGRGGGAITPDRPSSPTGAMSPNQPIPFSAPLSPRPSIMSLEMSESASIRSQEQNEGFSVLAYTVSRPIRLAEVHKTLVKSIRSSVRDELARLPDKVVDRIIKLVTHGVCPPTTSSTSQNHPGSDLDADLRIDFTDPTTAGEKLQDIVEAVYDEVMAYLRAEDGKSSALKRKTSGNLPWVKGEGGDPEKERLAKEEYLEKEASDAAERVEALVCRMLYNRLFSPIESDDARHDEVLASRIAALNMLDLSLDHLGLITQPDEVDADVKDKYAIQNGLRDIVNEIGDEFACLSSSSCLTPKDKADVLIRAHKLVVDGLAKLPPIQLRPEGEPYKPSSKSSTSGVLEDLEEPVRTPSTKPNTPTELSDMTPPDPDLDADATPHPSDENPLDRTPSALEPIRDTSIPQLTITNPAQSPESSMLEEAMSDSVMTIHASDAASPSPTPPANQSSQKPSTSGADLILPIIIYAVVKSNPAQLASHLMYLRRYRSAICLTGEASYAIVNLTAVIEFLEHVDMVELGLGAESDKVISVEDLTPIGLTYLDEHNADAASIVSASSRLRGRVFQVTEMAGSAADSANKVLTGVVDSSWTALRGLMSTSAEQQLAVTDPSTDATVPRPNMRPRQASTFSLASVTASVASIAAAASTAAARSRSRATSRASDTQQQWTGNQEMIDVSSRPESIYEQYASETEQDDTTAQAHNEDKDKDKEVSEMKSIKSVSSMMSKEDSSSGSKLDRDRDRATISNRLASIGVLGRLSSPVGEDGATSPSPPGDASPSKTGTGLLATLASGRARGASLFGGMDTTKSNKSPDKAEVVSPPPEPFDPPMERFLTCDVGDIKLSEIGPLLRDYRRLAKVIESLQQ